MAELARRAGLPRPEIEETAGCVTVRFRPTRYIPPERVQTTLSVEQRELLAILEEHQQPLRELRLAQPNRPEWAIKEDLARLKSLGLVDTNGHGRGAVWFRSQE
jgi:ATP-dependent DNA helicase RecG